MWDYLKHFISDSYPFIFTDTGDSVTSPVPGTASVLIEISEPIVTTNNAAGDASQSLRRSIRQRRVNSRLGGDNHPIGQIEERQARSSRDETDK